MLAEFLTSTAALPDLMSFWNRLRGYLREGLGMDAVRPLLRREADGDRVDARGGAVPLERGGARERVLSRETRALMVDEALAREAELLSPAEAAWLRENPTALLLALRRGPELKGALLLSWPSSREQLGAADLKLLTSLADQIALQYENLRLRALAGGSQAAPSDG
ncbi:MAG: hypothetical protein GF330_01985 [Candidatus Eisenbacteria bacterium]|nr:hypothetical protein [Candidatus Eisenbacteria bacterium]